MFEDLKCIGVTVDVDLCTVLLCRERIRNAVDGELLKELIIVLDWLRRSTEIRFVLMHNEGDVFSSGAHLGEIEEMLNDASSSVGELRVFQRMAHEYLSKMASLEQITFCGIGGDAYGAGVGLCLPFDFRIMARDANLCLPETRYGMFLTWGLTPRLVSLLGASKAKEWILFGDQWDADRCLESGLVEWVVDRSSIRNTALDLIEQLRSRSWAAIRMAKQIANGASFAAQFGDLTVSEIELAAEAMARGDTKERLKLFLKRGVE